MAETRISSQLEMTVGDAAVNGLLHGIAAGTVMAAYLLLALATEGESPAAVLVRFGPQGGVGSPLTGAVSHLAVSAIYGMFFALIWRRIGRRFSGAASALAGGLLYAALLFALAQIILLPASRSPMLHITLHFGLAHLIYGLVLGYLAR